MANQEELVRSFGVSALRVSRLETDGTPMYDELLTSAYNMRPIRIQRDPQTTTGERFEQQDGSGAVCAVKQNRDQVTGESLTVELCQFDMETIEIMTGAEVILDPVDPSIVRGLKAPDAEVDPNPTELDAWSEARLADSPATRPYLHWVWPYVTWTVAASSLEAGFLAVQLTGTAEGNQNIDDGAFSDHIGSPLNRFWNVFLANDIPDPDVAPYNAYGLAGGYIDTPGPTGS